MCAQGFMMKDECFVRRRAVCVSKPKDFNRVTV